MKVRNCAVIAHLPNPGRMGELLLPGARVLLLKVDAEHRKTNYEVLGVVRGRQRVLLDTRLSNHIAEEAINRGSILPLRGYSRVQREFSWKGSRFDFLLRRNGSKCIVEVKASTLLKGSMAMFPDAPTIRGRKHLLTLARAVKSGYRACVLFMVHRSGAVSFSANADMDPKFSEAFDDARAVGVEAYAYECHWRNREVNVTRRIPLLVTSKSSEDRSLP